MKYINKNFPALLILASTFFFVSCKKDSFTKANENPNAPQTVVPAVILPSIEISLAYTQGGDLTRFSTLFAQHSVGFSRQAQAYFSYVLTSTDFDTPWGNLYTSVLGNNKDLLTRADAGGYNVYGGIARILMAYSLQLLVDEWGKVPYSQALKGNDNTEPVFDDDKALYDTIVNLVDKAIVQLNDPNPGALTPGTDDIIYGGDASKWAKFGHAIKARIYIHQSKGDAVMAANALAEANQSLSDNSDDAKFGFGSAETAANPVYQFDEQRTDIDYASGAFVDYLNSLNDPRLTIYITPDYSDPFGSGIGSYFGSISSPVEFITYEEMLFVKAEATLRTTGDYAAAEAFYKAGIQASMDKLGVDAASSAIYIAANGTLPTTGVNTAIAKVSLQEYLALYLNPEAWTLWRRTGAPALTPTAGTNGIPRRFLYPQSEYSLNSGNAPQGTLYAPKIFWDK
ncbi:MAG: SusD/RagB family nutrient-binding outer membrane lipoprotein [Ginsengibacter sp.]